MTAASDDPLLHQVSKLLASHRTSQWSDRELLRRFASGRDEAAFAVLVERHGPMVLGVCRRLLHHEQDAEDVFQATFLVLARQAARRRWQESVGNWLFGVARRLALKMRGKLARRCYHPVADAPGSRTHAPGSRAEERTGPDPVEEITGRELLTALDNELDRLPESLRAALLLCFLQGHTQEEAAQRLGWSLGTLRRRLERGRQLLRTRLSRRGLALPAALSTAVLAHGAGPVPAVLTVVTLRAALSASRSLSEKSSRGSLWPPLRTLGRSHVSVFPIFATF